MCVESSLCTTFHGSLQANSLQCVGRCITGRIARADFSLLCCTIGGHKGPPLYETAQLVDRAELRQCLITFTREIPFTRAVRSTAAVGPVPHLRAHPREVARVPLLEKAKQAFTRVAPQVKER